MSKLCMNNHTVHQNSNDRINEFDDLWDEQDNNNNNNNDENNTLEEELDTHVPRPSLRTQMNDNFFPN